MTSLTDYCAVTGFGKIVEEGDLLVGLGGMTAKFGHVSSMPTVGKSGKVTVLIDGQQFEYYPSVFDLTIVKRVEFEAEVASHLADLSSSLMVPPGTVVTRPTRDIVAEMNPSALRKYIAVRADGHVLKSGEDLIYDFRGNPYLFEEVAAAPMVGKEGKITVRVEGGGQRTFYASVFDVMIQEEPPAALNDPLCQVDPSVKFYTAKAWHSAGEGALVFHMRAVDIKAAAEGLYDEATNYLSGLSISGHITRMEIQEGKL